MHAIQIYLDEELNSEQLQELKTMMLDVPHIENVEVNHSRPHDMLVEYEAQHNIPMLVMNKLQNKGLHPDIVSA